MVVTFVPVGAVVAPLWNVKLNFSIKFLSGKRSGKCEQMTESESETILKAFVNSKYIAGTKRRMISSIIVR